MGFSFGLRELLSGVAIIAIALFFEKQSPGLGAFWVAVTIGGWSVFYVRNRQDLIVALALGAIVFSVWWGIASNSQRYAEINPYKQTFRPPYWFAVISAVVATFPAGVIFTSVGFAFFKFWHFAMTRPLQFEINHPEDHTSDLNKET